MNMIWQRCIVGWVRRRDIIDGSRICPGDAIVGLPSTGLHTNGYSLARKVLLEKEGIKLTQQVPELGWTLGEELLAPHRCYWKVVQAPARRAFAQGIGSCHRAAGSPTTRRAYFRQAHARWSVWEAGRCFPIFDLIARLGRVPEPDMLRTFNMGIGMMLIVAKRKLSRVTALLAQATGKVLDHRRYPARQAKRQIHW